jgi:hypothetical protein
MGSARIRVDAETFERTDSGLTYGEIWLELDGRGFPDPGWTDFAVRVLSWWVDAVLVLLKRESAAAEVLFMDGPYEVEIEVEGPEAWRVSAIARGRLARRVALTSTVDPRPLAASVVAAAESALAMCRARGWEDADSRTLTNSLAILRRRGLAVQR